MNAASSLAQTSSFALSAALPFENPYALLALFFLIPLALAMTIHYWRRRRVPAFFKNSGTNISSRYWAASLAFLAFCAFAVIALAGPRWGVRLVSGFRRGADVVLAFDLSRSMDVRDGAGRAAGRAATSRLEEAAAIARDLVSDSGGPGGKTAGTVRYAVAIGKGQGILAIPLTEDTETVLSFLGGIASSSVTGRGTNLEKLIDAAASAFKDDFPGKRRIVLFSDGESLSGSLLAACDRALARDITIIAVGLGTETGGPVPADEPGSQGLISRANPQALRSAAERTGGIYLDGNSPGAASLLAEHIPEDSRLGSLSAGPGDSVETGFRREIKSQRHLFILAALAAFGLSKFLACIFRLPLSRFPAPLPQKRRPRRE